MTIALTAVSGQLGGEIARKLLELGQTQPVIGLARTPKNAQQLDMEIRPGDYAQPDELRSSLQGVDTLLLVPGRDSPDDRIWQHRHVIEAALAAGVGKIVYVSIQGPETGTGFSPVVQSNRQTEADVRASGMDWVIGRNGIYIEPDVEYVAAYKSRGEIANSAGHGKCGYTTRSELAYAYARLLSCPDHNGRTVDLNGAPITQTQLADYLNAAFGSQLTYRAMSSEEYAEDRSSELGAFFGEIIAGIYDGIRLGAYDTPGDFEIVAGRPHQEWAAYFQSLQT